MNIKKQLTKLLSLDFLGALNLTDSVWMLLLLSRGFSLWQAGVAEGIFHLVGFLCEIPSGMFADLYGRKKTLCASWIVFICASILMLCSHSMAGVCLAFGLNAIGYNLASGTREALTYDSLGQVDRAEDYLGISSWQNVLWRTSESISRLLAGVAVRLGCMVCYSLHVATSLFGLGIASTLTEAAVPHRDGEQRVAFRTVPANFMRQTREAVAFLRTTPRAGVYMLATASISGTVTLIGFFVQQQLVLLGAGGAALLGPLLFCMSLGGILGARLAVRCGTVPFAQILLFCGGGIALGAALCGLPLLPLCVLGGFGMNLLDETLCTITDSRLNDLFPSAQRATLVSVFSMCFSLWMVVVSPLLGLLCDLLGIGTAFGIMAVVLAVLTLCGIAATRRRDALTQ